MKAEIGLTDKNAEINCRSIEYNVARRAYYLCKDKKLSLEL
jgi:hypothetical protein